MRSANPDISEVRKPRLRKVVQHTQGYTAVNGLWEVQVQRSDPWEVNSETQAPDPRRHGSSLQAGWLAEVAALPAGSLAAVLSHSGSGWWGQEEGGWLLRLQGPLPWAPSSPVDPVLSSDV